LQNKKREVVLLLIKGVNFLNISKGNDAINRVGTSQYRKKWVTEPIENPDFIGTAHTLKVLFLLLPIVFLFSNCHKNSIPDDYENEVELDMMESGSAYLEKGGYEEANMIYSRFIVKYPDHPYVDDAAYRLAYMCVIADTRNPHFDYKNAVILFQNFIENYPNSRYINACNNWVNLLNSVKINSAESSVSSSSKQSDSYELNQLKIELKRVKAENVKLKNSLDELQKAIER